MTGRLSASDPTRATSDGTCPYCGKVSWRDRKAARKLARQRGNGLDAYECQLAPDYARAPWHVGHPPAQLKAGTITSDDVSSLATHRLRP